MSNETNLASKLASLRDRFVSGIPDRIGRIEKALILSAQAGGSVALETATRELHTLAGTAGTYGLTKIAALAREGELRFASILKAEQLKDVQALLDRLRYAARLTESASMAAEISDEAEASILVVGDTERELSAIVLALRADGFAVRQASGVREAAEEFRNARPTLVLTSFELPDGDAAAVAEIAGEKGAKDRPVILAVGRATRFSDQLRIARAVDACFNSGDEAGLIQISVREVLSGRGGSRGTILCVDDDVDHSDMVATILRERGYDVFTLSDPAEFDVVLTQSAPDLILLDVVMPEISGVDLARYARQQPAHLTTPIVFLTAQASLEARVEGLRAAADDYLLKPVDPGYLVSLIDAKLRRGRLMKALVECDGLTGALRQMPFEKRLEGAIQSWRRRADRYALVTIDLDHFKAVNDRYGNAVGDRVLVAFAAFLRRSVRAGDAVGRCGGEEFGLLLRDVGMLESEAVVSRILEQFKSVLHHAPDGTAFTVSFSAGIGLLTDVDSPASWKGRADEALYRAKRNGRARIEAAA